MQLEIYNYFPDTTRHGEMPFLPKPTQNMYGSAGETSTNDVVRSRLAFANAVRIAAPPQRSVLISLLWEQSEAPGQAGGWASERRRVRISDAGTEQLMRR